LTDKILRDDTDTILRGENK